MTGRVNYKIVDLLKRTTIEIQAQIFHLRF